MSFHLSILTDEISQDLGHALEVIAGRFGLGWVELRAMWNKNIARLDAAEIAEPRRLLEKHRLRVTDIASPLFKVDWPGAPKSRYSPPRDQFASLERHWRGAGTLEASSTESLAGMRSLLARAGIDRRAPLPPPRLALRRDRRCGSPCEPPNYSAWSGRSATRLGEGG